MISFHLFQKKNRTTNQQTGFRGEEAAVGYLKKNGYKIVDRNAKVGYSELDIVAVKGETLVFVEVKSTVVKEDKIRFTRPADAVNKSKRTYLVRGAHRYCAENFAEFGNYFKRFDIIEVYFTEKNGKVKLSEIKHFENAI